MPKMVETGVFIKVCLTHIIDPLQLVIHAVPIPHVGEQKMHCDKTNKGNCYFK